MTIRIVGIVLVRDEENFLAWAVGNAIDFCDEMLLIDNGSRDSTPERIATLAARHAKIRVIREPRALHTNRYVQPYLGKPVWVFGLDGDEIYDRDALLQLRGKLLAGAYSRNWSITGHSLHASLVDIAAGRATGYATPHAVAATKLYNFALIESWHEDTQRLHGRPVLRPGHSHDSWLDRAAAESWQDCDLRNLHLCFFPRSGRDGTIEVRKNITDRSLRNVWRRPVFRALQALGLGRGRLGAYLAPRATIKKYVRYMLGPLAERDVSGMLRPTAYGDSDPRAAGTEAMLSELSARRAASPDLRPLQTT
ncbi:glycosyltransferase [Devosia sp.]|uniref:glycosyltransferase n=1 Tax=Devosia sp. TaxID=1871048 RepID=UPI0035AFA878